MVGMLKRCVKADTFTHGSLCAGQGTGGFVTTDACAMIAKLTGVQFEVEHAFELGVSCQSLILALW